MSEAFEDKYLNANKKGLLFLEQSLVFRDKVPLVEGTGQMSNLYADLQAINDAKHLVEQDD